MVAKEIDVEWPLAVLPNGLQLFAQLLDAQQGGGHRPQAAGVTGGDDHRRMGSASHGALDDRQFDSKQVKNTGVWPLAHVDCSPTLKPGRAVEGFCSSND
ncbi:hypothetical protein D3C84_610170 [compost metagenome]